MSLRPTWFVIGAIALTTTACAQSTDTSPAEPTNVATVVDTAGESATSATPASPTTEATSTSTRATSTTTTTTTTSPTTTTTITTTPPATTSATTSAAASTQSPTTVAADVTPYAVPSPEPGSSWGDTHAGYSATDIFVPSGCGGEVVSPVNGTLLEVRRIDAWTAEEDNPATRGGKSIAILGDDGVRYYLAHFAEILPALEPGSTVRSGEQLGVVGTTGRSSACHIHFGISPPCPEREWSVRRGAVWPYPYLNAWRDGEQRSPADEIAMWASANPTACADAALDIHAPQS